MSESKNKKSITIIPDERVIGKIYYLRGKKVMFDRDLAELYNVDTKTLNRAVKRNIKRFPEDFMFQLNEKEAEILRYQFGTLETGKYSKYRAYVFTEQGVMMLSAVLRSDVAIEVSIQIVRVFIKLREILSTHKDLQNKIEKMERKYDENFKAVFKVIAKLMATDPKSKELKIIGFNNIKK